MIRLRLILLGSFFALPVLAGCTPQTFVPPSGAVVFRDDFEGTLKEGWTFTGADETKLSLTSRAGYARLWPQATDVAEEETSQLVREITGDFILTTRMNFDAVVDLELAGIIVRADDGRNVALGLLSATGSQGTFRGAILRADRGDDLGRVTASTELDGVYLRLARSGSSFTGAFSADDISYTAVGTLSNSLPDTVEIGIGVVTLDLCSQNCDQEGPADFDFFEISVSE